MPTLFARLDQSLEGSDLTDRLTTQGGNLANVASGVAGLIGNPPQSLTDLGSTINELPLPNLSVGAEYTDALDALQNALPTDLSGITGDLLTDLTDLGTTVDEDIARLLGEVLEAVLAVQRLTQLDLRCLGVTGTEEETGESGSTPEPSPESATGAEVGVSAATAQVEAIGGLLDAAPTPFDVDGALTWLRDATVFLVNRRMAIPVPILDELIDALHTLLTWRGMTVAEIRDHLDQTLQDLTAFVGSIDGTVADPATELTAAGGSIPAADLSGIADDLTNGLQELRTAVTSGDLSATGPVVANLNGRLDQYDTLRAGLSTGLLADLNALDARLINLPDELIERMEHLLSALRPSNALDFLAGLELPAPADPAALTAVQQRFQPLIDFLQEVTDQLDLTAISDPLSSVAETSRNAVDGLEQGLAGVTIEVRNLFAEVEGLLDGINPTVLIDQAEQAITAFGTQLNQQLADLFQPARDALAQVIADIDTQTDAFDPEDIIDALNDAIDSITGVLQNPDVQNALGQIRSALDTATQQLQELSFAPLTDQIIKAIEALKDSLDTVRELIDSAPDALQDPIRTALEQAINALPADLTPLTDPLLDDFDELIESGPVPLLETVKAQPQKLLDKVRSFDPGALVGDALGEPFADLVSRLESFKPSQLLAPVQSELDKLKDRLRDNVDPGAALQALNPPFARLQSALNQFDPDTLVQPLEEAITGAIDRLLEVLPTEEVFDQVDAALQAVERVIGLGDRLVSVIQKLDNLLDGLADAGTQVDAWLDGILAPLDGIDTSALAPRFADLSGALDSARAADLQGRFQSAADPVLAILDTLQPATRLTVLVQAHAIFPRPALTALPDSPEKTAIQNLLARFDPLEPDFGAPYRALSELRQRLEQTGIELQGVLTGWDARYHAPGGVLDSLRISGVTPAELRQWVREALEPGFVRPVKAVFGLAEPLRGPVGALLAQAQGLVGELQTKLTDLLLGPDSLGGIRDAIQELVQRLQDFNLDFLRQALQGVFDNVSGKLDGISPGQLREPVESAFNGMLATIDFDLIFPTDQIDQLDEDYADLVDKIKVLDPQTLVVEVVQDDFEEKIVPLLETFDLTDLLNTLIERLSNLDDELRQELERINQAYGDLRRALAATAQSVGVPVSEAA